MLWGGRFAAAPHPDLLRLTASIDVDIRLLEYDVAATKAHARSLAGSGFLSAAELEAIDDACTDILEEWRAGKLEPTDADEDVHSLVERELTARAGDAGARIHAGRSRNDLVATDLRLWCRDAAQSCAGLVGELVETLADIAAEHTETVMPGYTHLQIAQPISLGFHLAAHGFALLRDGRRFLAAGDAADVSALGAGALAGTTLPLDPSVAASELGFSGIFDNAMDAVSDRDFACDIVYAAALCGVHLSRLAEEMVLWTSSEFGYATLADEWSTGSSMMPQKRNPDLAELLRGRAAGGIADLNGLLILLKGLPFAYNRDLQEDKSFLFAAVDRVQAGLQGATQLIEHLVWHPERMAATAALGGGWATDLAERLVARGVAFREAHGAVGSLVAALESLGTGLGDAPDDMLSSHHRLLVGEDRAVADARQGLDARSSPGGTGSVPVKDQIDALRRSAKALP
ncbi:MAG: argininosuccinate lyase [Actinomycetota bacterium]